MSSISLAVWLIWLLSCYYHFLDFLSALQTPTFLWLWKLNVDVASVFHPTTTPSEANGYLAHRPSKTRNAKPKILILRLMKFAKQRTLAGSGTPQLPATGFQLDSGQSIAIPSVPGWSGRIWARTGCIFDATGIGSCQTGDCGGRLECDGIGATPPASLFEITLGIGDDKDFYDVSIVDGYNLPLVAAPRGVQFGCNATGCVADINMGCPKELQVIGSIEDGGVVACRSACDAFRLDEYCCSGEFANPSTCRPSFYSGIFKRACPRAYSYAFDDGTSTFTCKALEYAIIFCPNSGMRRIDGESTAPRIGVGGHGKVARMASSSTKILPFPLLIISILLFPFAM